MHLTKILILLAASALTLPAAGLTRAKIQSTQVGAISYADTPVSEILDAIRTTATTAGIPFKIDGDFSDLNQTLTLDASPLTLDNLLEFVTRTSGTEWTIDSDALVFFTRPDIRKQHEAAQKNTARQALRKIVLPLVTFHDTPVAEAFAHVRNLALKKVGTGGIPKIDTRPASHIDAKITLTVRNASVETLFHLIAALSNSRVDWTLQGDHITLIDEETRRKAIRQRAAATRRGSDSTADPFSDPFAGTSPTPAPSNQPFYRRISNAHNPGHREQPQHPTDSESYSHFGDNPFFSPTAEPLSTFSIDVDTASYANIRRLITNKQRIPLDAARIEELVNYFPYSYAPPAVGQPGEPPVGTPFASHLEVASAPWAPDHRLVRIGLKGYEIDWATRPASNLVFLLDVSGSMSATNKLDLVKQALPLLVDKLDERDRVAIVVYASASGLVLPSTVCSNKTTILAALDNLKAGGSTNGGAGIQLAYKTAKENFIEGGNNRVILCTDGDFNVGTTDTGSLTRLVEDEASAGVFLTALGFGMGNYKDDMMETISNKGNGNYAYIDSQREARKVFVHDLTGTLITIAKDVKIQVEFNPAKVGAYRLIGYENRLLEARDFNDDTKDAGEIGAGHTVTAFYEIVPPGKEAGLLKSVDPLKYQKPTKLAKPAKSDELLTLKLRYKAPDADASQLLTFPLTDPGTPFDQATPDFRFASAVAAFGMTLRNSDYRGEATAAMAQQIAADSLADDPHGYREEFLDLLKSHQATIAKR